MPKPRAQQAAYPTPPYYHVISRCVREPFSCGKTAPQVKRYSIDACGLKTLFG